MGRGKPRLFIDRAVGRQPGSIIQCLGWFSCFPRVVQNHEDEGLFPELHRGKKKKVVA